MKYMIFTFLILGLQSCSKSKSNGGPVVQPTTPPVTATDTYQYTIKEVNAYNDIICSTGRMKNFNSFQAMCDSIMNEYQQGRCDRACSKLLYESVKCGEIPEEFNSFSCSNYYLKSSQSY